jgi:hypothetical protein
VPLQFDESERRSRRGTRNGKGDVEGAPLFWDTWLAKSICSLQTCGSTFVWRNAESTARFVSVAESKHPEDVDEGLTRRNAVAVRSGALERVAARSPRMQSKPALSPDKHSANTHRRKW